MRKKNNIPLIFSTIVALSTTCTPAAEGENTIIKPPPGPNLDNDSPDYVPNYNGDKLNVILLIADDFNNWAKCTGYYPEAKTPNLDALASKGVLFRNALSPSPVSNPSRNAIMSGIRPSTSGIWSNSEGYIRDKVGFENVLTMNQYFTQNGYYTYGAGKIYHPGSMGGSQTHIDKNNWSELNENRSGSRSGGPRVAEWTNPAWETMSYKVGAEKLSRDNSGDYGLALDAADFITNYSKSENADKPFFLATGFFRPHLPWNLPDAEKFWDQYPSNLPPPQGYLEGDKNDLPGNNSSDVHNAVVNNGKWSEAIRTYLSCMSHADYCVGLVLSALDKSPYKDNTVVVFYGDHGWQLGEKDKWGKNTIYNAASKTTFIIYYPDSINKDVHTCEYPVSLQDVYPTLIDLCNLPQRSTEELEGNNITALIENPNDSGWNKPVISTYSGTPHIQDKYYKYIGREGEEQFYDLQRDPYEQNNLLYNGGSHPKVNEYRAKLNEIIDKGTKIRKNKGLGALYTIENNEPPVRTSLNSENVKGSKDGLNLKSFSKKIGVNIKSLKQKKMITSVLNGKISLDLLYADVLSKVTIYDKKGKILFSQDVIGETQIELDVKNILKAGSYYIVINSSNEKLIDTFKL